MSLNKKFIASNYSSIAHLPGSKTFDSTDLTLSKTESSKFTDIRQLQFGEKIIVTEKLDGCNLGVVRQNNDLICVIRKGYLCKDSPEPFIRNFEEYVEINRDRFLQLLVSGERAVCEWMVKTHSLGYRLPHEPCVILDIIKHCSFSRLPYLEMVERSTSVGFPVPGLIHMGIPINPYDLMVSVDRGLHGCETVPEGLVYRLERCNKFICIAKFVRSDFYSKVSFTELKQKSLELQKNFFFKFNKWGGSFRMSLKKYSVGTEYEKFIY